MTESNDTEETTTDDAGTAPEATPAAEATPAPEPVEQLPPKEARRRARSQAGEARPARTIEERAQERAERRKKQAAHRRAYRAASKQRAKVRRDAAPAAPETAPAEKSSGRRKVRMGVVVSDKADKTITVKLEAARRHRRYEKIVRTSSTLHAHDEGNEAHIGDTVRVVESRPLSRTKRWRLVEILERAR